MNASSGTSRRAAINLLMASVPTTESEAWAKKRLRRVHAADWQRHVVIDGLPKPV